MKSKIYGFPILPKAGLGNMLIPWADCYIWCKDLGIQQIAPFWRKIRVGPYLRGERDKRQYQKLFISGNMINGLSRLFLLLISKRISAEEFRNLNVKKSKILPTLVTFSDMNKLDLLLGRHEEVLNELYKITKPKFWPVKLQKSFIGIHIRMGDFPEKSNSLTQINFRIPLEWYIESLNQIRMALGNDFPVVIFSDGTDKEIESILKLPNVIRSPYSESISDLLAIAKSTVIITSRSSYSLFAAFLGQVPSIWYSGKDAIYKKSYMPTEKNGNLEIEWMPGQFLTAEFIESLKERI
nr:alpha-1,2-fucosyltransferase [uncultured Flavobacterium sp.]